MFGWVLLLAACSPGTDDTTSDVRPEDATGERDDAAWADVPDGDAVDGGPDVGPEVDVGDGDVEARPDDGSGDGWDDGPYDAATGWSAELVSWSLPAVLEQGTTFAADVVMRNVGTTSWPAAEVKLGALDDEDPLAAATRIHHTGTVAPGEYAAYRFTLTAPMLAEPRRVRNVVTDWRMVNDGPEAQWFGPTVRRHVSVYDATPVSADGLENRVLAGYQGWFTCPGAPADIGWTHWCRDGGPPDPGNVTFDLWPDLTEYAASELCATSFAYPDGRGAGLYSAWHASVIDRHFRWMKEYGIDGVWLQRFASELRDPRFLVLRDQVLRNVMAAAESHGRVFGVMYDISGMATSPPMIEQLTNDWMHLVDEVGVTASPRYVRHAGRPVLGLWGLGFDDRPGVHDDDCNIILHLQSAIEEAYRVTLVGGVPEGWRTSTGSSKPDYSDVYNLYSTVSPWSVGRYDSDASYASFRSSFIVPDLAALGASRYLPVVWPGFSWTNLTRGANPLNQIPRRAGDFLWRQAWGAWSAGARMLFLAMFDEVDEGTALFKAAASAGDGPTTGTFLTLDADGTELPSDWYLRLAGEIGNLFRGVYADQPEKPLAP